MDIINLLAVSENFINFAVDGIATINLNWIGKLISWLFNLFSSVPAGVGIGAIVFTLALKTLVLPLDVISKIKMKKQALLMEDMRPQMEKLQKQYANDKQMYSQKVLELQKQNGYSPLGACLPTVVALVIFMVVFSSFSTYSNYAMLCNYNDMVDAYNGSVVEYVLTDDKDASDNKYFLLEEDGNYRVDFDKFAAYYGGVTEGFNAEEFAAKSEADKFEVVSSYVRLNARAASAEYYRTNKKDTSFLWIGNMWYPDTMFNKEVPTFSKFSSAIARAVGTGMSVTYEESYNEVVYNLNLPDPDSPNKKPEMQRYNGYFVLVVLSIGLMFLQQFIMMRSQKASNELSSVDGSAAKTTKWMMIIMPVVFGLVAFLYSAAFSIYMITNTAYGLISTVIINKAVSVRFSKNKDKIIQRGNRPQNRKRLK